MRTFAGGPVIGVAILSGAAARAKCADPRGCFTELCATPGNVLEVISINDVDADGYVTVRVEAVHVVDATRFTVPTVGEEIRISVGSNDVSTGDRFVALSREEGNVAWPLFGLDDLGMVTCLQRPSETVLRVDEVQAVVLSGECEGDPLPEPLTECDDNGNTNGCGAGGASSMVTLALVSAAMLRRRNEMGVDPVLT